MRPFLLAFFVLCITKGILFAEKVMQLANYTIVGQPTTIEHYPSLVHLETCVGTLVSPIYVLTAGHCIHSNRLPPKAYIGNTNKLKGKQMPLAKIYRHPKFNRGKHNPNFDIALLRLVSPVTLSNTIKVSDMAKPTDVFPPGTLCMVAGWGSLSRKSMNRTSKLHTAIMKITKPSECIFKQFYFDVKSEMCLTSIAGVNQAAAPGDSGAPLWCQRSCDHKLVVAGVDSRGVLPDKNHRSLDIFTKVSFHYKWLRTVMHNHK